MRRFGLLAFLVVALLVGAVGVMAYNLGFSAGATDAAIEAGASVIYAPAAGISPFGAIIGLFFVILIIGFVIKAIAGPRVRMGPGPWGRHGRGYPGWDHDTVPDHFRPMLERWHRDVHGSGSATAGQTRSAPPPAGRPTAGPSAAPPQGPATAAPFDVAGQGPR